MGVGKNFRTGDVKERRFALLMTIFLMAAGTVGFDVDCCCSLTGGCAKSKHGDSGCKRATVHGLPKDRSSTTSRE